MSGGAKGLWHKPAERHYFLLRGLFIQLAIMNRQNTTYMMMKMVLSSMKTP